MPHGAADRSEAHDQQSPDLAERLGISDKTMRSYLKAVYARTGVNTREGLADLVRSGSPAMPCRA